jgi:hypothetical protein
MELITGGGAFTARNIAAINSNFAAVEAIDYWVRPQAAVPDADGTYAKPFASLTALGSRVTSGVRIGLEGVLKEEYSSPIVNDVTIIGARSNTPRQATTSGVPNGGGATWLSPTSGTGSLLTINGQGWRVENIYFNNTATGATPAGRRTAFTWTVGLGGC